MVEAWTVGQNIVNYPPSPPDCVDDLVQGLEEHP